jgi:hypothetical protein
VPDSDVIDDTLTVEGIPGSLLFRAAANVLGDRLLMATFRDEASEAGAVTVIVAIRIPSLLCIRLVSRRRDSACEAWKVGSDTCDGSTPS